MTSRTSPRTNTWGHLRKAAAVAALLVCGLGRAADIDEPLGQAAGPSRLFVVKSVAVGRLTGALLAHGVLTQGSEVPDAQGSQAALGTVTRAGLVGLAADVIAANRQGQDEAVRPCSDGQSFREQHPRDVSGTFVAALPPVRF